MNIKCYLLLSYLAHMFTVTIKFLILSIQHIEQIAFDKFLEIDEISKKNKTFLK